MKTRRTLSWLAGVAGGLLVAVSALGWAGPPWGRGGIKGALEACEAELQACREEPCAIFPGDGQTGPELSYTNNGDGTFTDNSTLLIWEIKDGDDGVEDYTNPHDVNNLYTWYQAGTVFLDELNGEQFAGYEDWRLPTVKELLSLMDYSVPPPGPCVADDLPGATYPSSYWSSTAVAGYDDSAWAGYFYGDYAGSARDAYTGWPKYVRAVRGGW